MIPSDGVWIANHDSKPRASGDDPQAVTTWTANLM